MDQTLKLISNLKFDGEVFFADTSGLHCASQIKKNFRYITQIRFGKPDGYSAVVDGFCQTPTQKELSFLKIIWIFFY